MISTTPPVKQPNVAAERDDSHQLATIIHELFSASSAVRSAIADDDVFVQRFAALDAGFAQLRAEADRLEDECVANPTAASLAKAAVQRVSEEISRRAHAKAKQGIKGERYQAWESRRPSLGRACAKLYRAAIDAVKKLPEATSAEIHSNRVFFVNDCRAAVERLETGACSGIGPETDPLAIERLRGYLQTPERQPDPVDLYPAPKKHFEFVEETPAAKEARENAAAARAKEESRKHGFATAYTREKLKF